MSAEAFAKAGFGPCGDLWSVINGSRMLTALRATGQLDTRCDSCFGRGRGVFLTYRSLSGISLIN
jgi:hypothetical protein